MEGLSSIQVWLQPAPNPLPHPPALTKTPFQASSPDRVFPSSAPPCHTLRICFFLYDVISHNSP